MRHQFKILSIDGGGIRGIIPCRILQFIEQQTRPISNIFDLIAGTSTGGIIALALTMPNEYGRNNFSTSQVLELYTKFGKEIFGRRYKKDILNQLLSYLNDNINTLLDNNYDQSGLEKLLTDHFGNMRLSQALTNILVTSYEMQKGKTFYFQSRLAKKNEEENFLLKEIARSTSAAPTYFAPSIVKFDNKEQTFIDGGVFANNPSILAYGEAKELWKRKGQLAFEPNVKPDDNDLPFFMLSLGTGYSDNSFSIEEVKTWRTHNWIRPLLTDVFMRSVSESTHFTMKHLLPKYLNGTPRYVRINLKIPKKHSEMDNVSIENIQALTEIADKFINENKSLLITICQSLMN